MNVLSVLGSTLLKFFYPTFCLYCKKIGVLFCPDCLESLDFSVMKLHLPRTTSLTSVRAVTEFGPAAQSIVHALKFSSVKGAGSLIGRMVYWYAWLPKVDFLVPVPLSRERFRERGYNQASVITKTLSHLSSIPVLEALIKTHHTKAQAQQTSGQERWHNLSQAFAHNPEILATQLQGAKVLLIDDVVSTGATLESCAQVLRCSGTAEVHGMAFSHGQISNSRGIMEYVHGDVLH